MFFKLHAEFVSDGSRLLLSLVRRVRGGENFCTNRLPTVPEGDVDLRGEVLHRLSGSFCLGNTLCLNASRREIWKFNITTKWLQFKVKGLISKMMKNNVSSRCWELWSHISWCWCNWSERWRSFASRSSVKTAALNCALLISSDTSLVLRIVFYRTFVRTDSSGNYRPEDDVEFASFQRRDKVSFASRF